MSNPVATVAFLQGQAWAKSPDGSLRPLTVGSVLQDNEIVVTAEGARVELDLGNSEFVTVQGGQELGMSPDLNTDTATNIDEALLSDASVQEALKVLEEGGDLTETLEETAAGLGGGAGGGGHDFVRLARIVELTENNNYSFQTEAESAADAELRSGTINHAPLVTDQALEGAEDTTISGRILATDVEKGVLIYEVEQGPTSGTLQLDRATGQFIYTPTADYNGPDSFVVTVIDDHGNRTSSRIDLTITPVNDAPVSSDQNLTTLEDTPVDGQVVATDIENDTLSYVVSSPAANGTVSLDAATGVFTYIPNADYNGSDSFIVTIDDGQGGTTTSKITIGVIPVNDAPVSADQNLTTPEDTPLDGQINASDIDKDVLSYSISSPVTHGTVSLNPATGAFTYTPNADYNGSDRFVVTIDDGQGGTTTSTVNIGVTPVNDAPVSADQNLTTPEDTSLAGQVVARDVDGDTLSYNLSTPVTHGTLILNATTGVFTYTPNANYNGSDRFVVTIDDGQGGTTTSTINIGITPVNDAPVSADQNLITPEDVPINGQVVASDVDGDALNYRVTTIAANGTVSLNAATGAFVYSPNANFNGSDRFVVTVSDGNGGVTSSTINIGVTPVNDDPVANNLSLTTPEDTAVSGAISASDVDGDSLTYNVIGAGPSNGSLSFNSSTGGFVYTPNHTYTGSDSFQVRVSDGQGGSTTSTVSIGVTPVSDPVVNSITSPSAIEGADLSYSVTLSRATTNPLSLPYSLGGGSAIAADYGTPTFSNGVTLVGGNLIIPVGVASFSVTVPTVDDVLSESTETLPLIIGGVTGTGSITDNDGTPSLSINNISVNEGAGTATFTVTLSSASSQAVSVNYASSNGTATAGSDYTAVNGTLNFAAGDLTKTITVPITDDSLAEGPENFSITLSTPSNATLGTAVGTGTIVDNDGAPSLSINNISVNEGAGTATFTVTLSAASGQAVTVNYASSNGTATAGSDYTAVNGTLNFAAGDLTKTITVPISDDSLFEGNENFTITLSGANNASIATATGTGTIVDNDSAPTVSSISSPTVVEGADLVYNIALSNASTTTTTLAYTLGGGSASAADYGTPTFSNGVTLVGSNLLIPAGVTTFSVTVPTVDDVLSEPTETLPLIIGGVTGTGSITDNDGAPSLSINNISVNEGAGTATFTVTLSAASGQAVTVNYASSNGTATAGSDYTAVNGTLNFAAGDLTKTITVPITDDTIFEGPENFTITLSGANNASIATATGTGTIVDNDSAPTVSSISSPTVVEGADLVYNIALSNASTTTTTLAYTLGGGSASAADYGTPTFSNGVTLVGSNLLIPAGVTTFSVTVPTVDDVLSEPTETLPLIIGGVTGTGSITDNDGAPSLSINNISVNEGAGTATFTVTLSAASGQAVSVNYASSNGTATAGSDYTAVSGTLNFAAGDLTKTITVPISDDSLFEGNENFTITLSSATNASIATATGTGTIVDNDSAPTVSSISSPTVVEGADLVYNIALSNASTTTTTLAYTLGGGSASAADYGTPTFSSGVTLVGSNLLIPAGVTTFSVTVPTVDDVLSEPTETLPLIIGGVTGTGSITDNDGAPSLSINNISVNEGAGTATFTVTLSAASGQAVTVNYASSNGTATAGSDYTAVNGTLNFAAGDLTKTITVPITDDSLFEGNENFTITLSGATNASIATATGTGTIVDNDSAPTVSSISSPTVVEGADLVYNIALSNASTTTTTLAYTLGGGSASAADYGTPTFSNGVTLVGSNLLIPAGVTTFSVTVPTVDDVLSEPTETLPLIIGGVTGTGSITDNDGAPSLSINNISVNEGAGTATFTVTLSAASGQAVSVNYASSNGTATAGSDYTAVSGTLNFAAGDLTKTITVPITDDSLFEGNENFTITLSGATNASIATATGTGTIVDNDSAPTVSSISSPTVVEGADLVYNIALSNASTTTTTLAYTLGGGSASAADYGTPTFSNGVTLVGSNLLIPAGVTSFSVTVPTVDDVLSEPTETLPLIIGGVTGTGSITDNDGAPSLSINNISVNEGAGTATFTVTLSAASGQAVTVNYASSNGTATAGSDYTAVNGTLNFAAGDLTKTITVPITDDTIFEGPENFTITLSGANNASIATATGTGTIVDNDSAPTVSSISSPTVVEGADLVYNIALSNASTTTTTLAYTLGGGSASAADYGTPTFSNGVTLVGSNLLIPAGVTTFSVTVPTVDDVLSEPTETLPLIIGGVTGTGSITDNDGAPSLSINNISVNEGAGTATFTVTLSAASGQAVSVNYASSNGTATAGSDYTAVSGTLNFAAGDLTKTITVPISDDSLFEGNENFTITLSSATNASIATATGTGTIVDNDSAPTVSSISSPTVVEGADLVYNIALSNASTTTTTLAYTLGGGSASAADYGTPTFSSGVTLVGSNLLIPAGVTTFSVTVPTVDDVLSEPTETLPLIIGGVTGTGSITDNDGAPSLSINNISVNEGAGTATFTVTLSAASGQAVTVNYASSNGTATAGSDYTAVNGTLNFAAGDLTKTITVPITDDSLFEGNENFTITLSGATNASIATATGTGTIVDNDSAPTVSSISSPTVVEGADLVYNIALSNASTTTTTLAYTLGGGSASAADYGTPTFSNGVTLVGSNLLIPAGVTTFSVTVPTVDDVLSEPTETLPLIIGGVTGTGSITDNDGAPSLSINNISVNEGAGTATFTVTLSAASGQAVSVNYASSNGTATAGSDYTAVSGTLNFAAGDLTKTITVPITDDSLFEGNENFTITLSGATNASIATATGTGTIVDNDSAPTVSSISSPTVVEGADLVYNIALSNASTTTTTLAYTLGGGSASAADYGTPTFSNGVTLVGSNLLIPAGVTSFSVTVPTVDDVLSEPTETLPLIIGGVTGTGSITDNDGAPSLSINNISVNEGAGTATFTVTLSAASGQAVTVNYASSNGTATAGSDYTAVNGTLNFAAGDLTKTITVPITDDSLFEGNENFTITLSGANNASIATATGTGTIVDNDSAPTVSSISSPTVVEGADLVYNIALSNASTTTTTLAYTLGGGSASAADYGTPTFSNGVTLVGSNLLIPAGVTTFSVTVPTVDDVLSEPTETLPLIIGGVTGTGSITDNDGAPSLSINNISVNEGAGTATFTVTLSAASGQAVTVNYASSNGTATAGSDYTAVNGTLNFAAGDLTKTITVPITDDSLFEGNENFTITLSGANNASIATATGTGTIVDNDSAPTVSSISSPTVVEGADLVYNIALSNASTTTTTLAYTLGGGSASAADYGTPTFSNGVTLVGSNLLIPAGVTTFSVTVPTVDDVLSEPTETLPLIIGGVTGTGSITDNDGAPSLSINNISVNEGAGTATFTVTLSAASGQAVSVNYASSNGTATAGSDYTAVNGTLNFAAGDLTKTITVPISDDSLFEGNENFTITLSSATNASIATATGTGTIVDNDSAPTVSSISSPTVVEGADLVYNIALSNASTTTTTLAYTLGGGSASAADYGTPTFSSGVTLVGSNLLIPAGVTTFSVTVPTVDDVLSEPTETLPLIIGGVTGTGSITDNDGAPSLSINNISVNEGAGTATFTVTLSAASGQAVTVNYASSNGTATAGSDYTAVNGTLNFAAGDLTKTITVPITDDSLFEGNENFTITLSGATNASIATATGTGTIVDNDSAPTVSSISSPTVVEGADLVYNIALSNASTTTTTLAYTLGGGSASAADYGTPTFSNGVTLVGSNLLIPAGVTTFSVTVPTVDDVLSEPTETLPLIIGGVTGTGSITDNDGAPSLSINNISVNEGAGTATFTVTLSAASGQAVSVNYASSNGTATAGSDYTAVSGTLNFAAGDLTKTITVPISDDSLFEGNENFTITLSGASNASIATATGTGTIVDNDSAPTVSSISSPTVVEGADLVYNIALSNASTTTTTLAYTLGGGSASAADYGTPTFSNGVTLVGSNLLIPAGVTTFSVTVPTVDDVLSEPTETLPLIIGGVTGTGSITDNDGAPSLSINNISVNEGAGTATFTVTLSAASGQAVTVNYASSNGTATAGSDYTAVNGTLNFAAGDLTKTITVPISDDSLFEGNENFTITLSSATNASIATATGTGTIIDNDLDPLNHAPKAVNDPTTTPYNINLGNTSTDFWGALTAKGVNLAFYKANGSVGAMFERASDHAIGVATTPRTVPGTSVADQIEYDQTTGKSEAIVMNFTKGALSQATFSVSNLFPGENGGEMGAWEVSYQGVIIAANTFRLTGTSDKGTFTIDTGGRVFDSVKFTALNTNNGTGDGGDYFITNFVGSGPGTTTGSYVVNEGGTSVVGSTSSVRLLANDTDADGDTLKVTHINGNPITEGQSISLPSGATLVIHTDGSFSYATNTAYDYLNAGQLATNSFTYSISDGRGGVDTATATMTIVGAGPALSTTGTSGNDTIVGTSGADLIIGGAGNDSLTGALGADTFKWSLADKGSVGAPATDTVIDFSNAQGDVLHLSELLQGENSGNLTNYLHFTYNATANSTTISISSSGAYGAGGYSAALTDQIIVLNGYSTSGSDTDIINQLKAAGRLITD